MEPLSKEEFSEWKTNHFDHLCLDVAGIKKDIGWLKWLMMGIALAILLGFLKIFLGI